MKRIIVAALAAITLSGVAASAQDDTPKTNLRHGCGHLYSQSYYRHIAIGEIREKKHVGHQKLNKLAAMRHCAKSDRAQKNMLRYTKHLLSERREWLAWKDCSNSNPTACAYAAAARFGISAQWLINCARSEGGLGPSDYDTMNTGGSGAGGNWQFMSGTFYGYAPRAGLPRPHTWLDSHDQAWVAAYMFSIGESDQWTGAGC